MEVLLAIKPEFVEKIFSGEKNYEFRKVVFKKEVDKVLIYASSPISKVVGEFEVKAVIQASLSKLWDVTKEGAGISEAYFRDYFKNKHEGCAIKIGRVKKYDMNGEMIYPIEIETANKVIDVDYETSKKIDSAFHEENETVIGWQTITFKKKRVAVLVKNITQLVAIPKKGYAVKYRPGFSGDECKCYITEGVYGYLRTRLDFESQYQN